MPVCSHSEVTETVPTSDDATRTPMAEKSHVSAPEGAPDTKESFEVRWDGDEDPINPRNMGTARKWMIVLLVSTSSLCVYVASHSG